MKQLSKRWGEECVSGPCCFPLPLVRQGSFTIYSSRPQKPLLPKIRFGPCWLNRQRLRKKKLDSEGCPAVWLSLIAPKQMNPISYPLYYHHVYGQSQRNSGPKKSQPKKLRVDSHPQGHTSHSPPRIGLTPGPLGCVPCDPWTACPSQGGSNTPASDRRWTAFSYPPAQKRFVFWPG